MPDQADYQQPGRLKDYGAPLPVIEIYPCLQGEGAYPGRPLIAVRTTGCTHRCYFGEAGGWCDTWYASIHPEKGRYCFNDIIAAFNQYPHIRGMMLTGGAPTMHPRLLNELSHFARQRGIAITLETEGSHFIATDYPLDYISLSPKLSNSVPVAGQLTPRGRAVDERLIRQHNKYRLNIPAMRQLLDYHKDYQYKPVWDGTEESRHEIEQLRCTLAIPGSKTFVMPAGQTREQLIALYGKTMEMCLQNGYGFSGRSHIIAFDDQRGV